MAMLGHKVTLTETNTHGWIPLCECGWIGIVHQHIAYTGDDTQAKRDRIASIQSNAFLEHHRHLDDERARIAAEHSDALDSHAHYVETARSTLTRIGRWGSG